MKRMRMCAVLLTVFLTTTEVFGQPVGDIVAWVGGQQISEDDVQIPDAASDQIANWFGDQESRDEFLQARTRERFVYAVLSMLEESLRNSTGAEITRAMLDDELEVRDQIMGYEESDYDDTATLYRETKVALELALEDPEEANRLFKESLSPRGMSGSTWNHLKSYYDSADEVEKFWVPESEEQLRTTNINAVASELVRVQLYSDSFPEIWKEYNAESQQALQSGDAGVRLLVKREQLIARSRALLWKANLENGNLRILDPRFRNIDVDQVLNGSTIAIKQPTISQEKRHLGVFGTSHVVSNENMDEQDQYGEENTATPTGKD